MKLKEYNKKRNFNMTSEPKGECLRKSKSMKYVVQYHTARTVHFDFRLENKEALVSWAIPKGLPEKPNQRRLAVKVEDHPLEYYNFEGVIPKGQYGAGTVEIWDRGVYVCKNLNLGLKNGKLQIALKGEKLEGVWSLIRMDDKNWLIIKTDNKKNNASKKKKYKNPFNHCDVQLATLTNTIPKGKNWLFEIKYDGYRAVAYIHNKRVKFLSRNNKDYTKQFESLITPIIKASKGCSLVLDGEVVVFNKNGKSDFGLLQHSLKHKENNLNFCVFDILAKDGKDLRQLPLIQRKEILHSLLKVTPPEIVLSEYAIDEGVRCFALAKKYGLEGIVAKDLNSHYNGTRNNDWQKIKCRPTQEFVIGGYLTTIKNKDMSALLVGYFEGKNFIYAGKVGTGFNTETKVELVEKLKDIKITNSPFLNFNGKANFVKPKYIAQVEFAEMTKAKLLRQASFIGLRNDKPAKSVVLEQKNE